MCDASLSASALSEDSRFRLLRRSALKAAACTPGCGRAATRCDEQLLLLPGDPVRSPFCFTKKRFTIAPTRLRLACARQSHSRPPQPLTALCPAGGSDCKSSDIAIARSRRVSSCGANGLCTLPRMISSAGISTRESAVLQLHSCTGCVSLALEHPGAADKPQPGGSRQILGQACTADPRARSAGVQAWPRPRPCSRHAATNSPRPARPCPHFLRHRARQDGRPRAAARPRAARLRRPFCA